MSIPILEGAFCNNIRVFLQECGQLHDVVVKGMPAWCTLLVHDTRKFLVPLYTIEENVVCSPKPYCDHCRYAVLFLEFPITGRSSSECLAATVECDICEVCVAAHSLLWHWGH
ncbi:hypothetical protein I3760_04G046800 [Carya illinoinensis]|nr:hypothetical protein I3760_04G046800 [Carya illinoinensis]